MKNIPTEEEYMKAEERMEEIIKSNLVTNNTPSNDQLFQELDKVSDIVKAYEEIHFPIEESIIKYRDYRGTVEFSKADGCYFGQVLDIGKSLISYEGSTLEEMEIDFRDAIDEHINDLAEEKSLHEVAEGAAKKRNGKVI
ncbi:hypothetical protein [Labilibacter marinus]|uniref:hypothetical protein n=1 Tax=Labilibacter marinus TaxID=1477105 RepID=UPI0009502021|nr:hypothetical protein [Labilibacter marinus]